jgi:hypothetical protein
VNTEERKLAELLHRTAPEPPRPVTVEQVAYRLVTDRQPQPGRSRLGRDPRPRRRGLSRVWAPVAAAAAVVVVAGASVGIAALASSHHTTPPVGGGAPASSTLSSGTVSSSPSQTPASSEPPGTTIPGAPWGAQLIDHEQFFPGSLVSADGSLYAYGNDGTLDRIDPATGTVVNTARYTNIAATNPPVVVGNTVWVVWSYNGGNIVLHGYNATTLAQTSSILVPAIGGVSLNGQGVLTSGPDGDLYVAAGDVVAVVNPATGQVTNRIQVLAGKASSVAVSPDGSKLYVGIESSLSAPFKLLVYDLPTDNVVGSSTLTEGGAAGNLVATAGGVLGTTGSGHGEWVWFAPGGDLARASMVGQGAGGGWDVYPSYSGGVVWVGGTGALVCASPTTGQVLARTEIPADQGSAQFLSSPVVADGQGYSSYQTNVPGQISGLARVTPPTACTGSAQGS